MTGGLWPTHGTTRSSLSSLNDKVAEHTLTLTLSESKPHLLESRQADGCLSVVSPRRAAEVTGSRFWRRGGKEDSFGAADFIQDREHW